MTSLKFLFKVFLCVIQLVCVYRLFRHDDYSLVPVQLFIVAIIAVI